MYKCTSIDSLYLNNLKNVTSTGMYFLIIVKKTKNYQNEFVRNVNSQIKSIEFYNNFVNKIWITFNKTL